MVVVKRCSECTSPALDGLSRCHLHNERHKANNIRHNMKLKEMAIAQYGGVCVCCGEAEILFLSLHHPDGDGALHRFTIAGNSTATGKEFYRQLRNRGFPPGLEVLCHNCHMAIEQIGYCPKHGAGPVIVSNP